MYLEETSFARQMNDRNLKSDEGSKSQLCEKGVAPALATYFAHVLGREPLISTACMPSSDAISNLTQDPRMESLNTHMSTWWPHVRLKLPVLSASNDSLPWRVEFRPMEAQPSDMENAALVVALRVLQRTIQHFGLDLKIPISSVEENMNRASDYNAATDQTFRFAVRPIGSSSEPAFAFDDWASLDVIFNGNGDDAARSWHGLLPLARDYLTHCNVSSLSTKEQEKILGALELLSARASGRLETPARWMRNFVAENSCDSPHDKEISSRLYYDMILALLE
jgi:glutamate--cysteine ligase catalytic subunit